MPIPFLGVGKGWVGDLVERSSVFFGYFMLFRSFKLLSAPFSWRSPSDQVSDTVFHCAI